MTAAVISTPRASLDERVRTLPEIPQEFALPLSAEAEARLRLALNDIPQAARKRERKWLPIWVGDNLLSETIHATFDDALGSLRKTGRPGTITVSGPSRMR